MLRVSGLTGVQGATLGRRLEGRRPFARRRPGSSRDIERSRCPIADNVPYAPSPTRVDCRTRGESSTPVPQNGRPLLTTVPHGSCLRRQGVTPLAPAAVARWVRASTAAPASARFALQKRQNLPPQRDRFSREATSRFEPTTYAFTKALLYQLSYGGGLLVPTASRRSRRGAE